MTRTKMTLRAGTVVAVSAGMARDYRVQGVFSVAKDVNVDKLLTEWLGVHPGQRAIGFFKNQEFLAWVTAKGYLKRIDAFEWHLDSQGTPAEEMAVIKMR